MQKFNFIPIAIALLAISAPCGRTQDTSDTTTSPSAAATDNVHPDAGSSMFDALGPQVDMLLDAVFQSTDTDGSGSLSEEEINAVMKKGQEDGVVPDEFAMDFKEFPVNKETFKEFMVEKLKNMPMGGMGGDHGDIHDFEDHEHDDHDHEHEHDHEHDHDHDHDHDHFHEDGVEEHEEL